MRKFFSALLLIPLGLVLTVFAVANRHLVTVSFDPFNSSDPTVAVRMPLFVVIIVVAIIGVAAGGSATWFRQRHWRHSARRYEAEARAVRSQLAGLRAGTAAPRGELPRLPAPMQAGGYRSAGRDKQDATL